MSIEHLRARDAAKHAALLARRRAYRKQHADKITAQVRATQQRIYAEGRCVTCGNAHNRISQQTGVRALRCGDCTGKQVDANKRRNAARKVAA